MILYLLGDVITEESLQEYYADLPERMQIILLFKYARDNLLYRCVTTKGNIAKIKYRNLKFTLTDLLMIYQKIMIVLEKISITQLETSTEMMTLNQLIIDFAGD